MLTAIFIDGGYVDKCAASGIDYAKLSQTLAGDERILQTYYYNGYPYDCSRSKKPDPKHIEVYERKIKFFRSLEELPKFTCRYGYTAFRDGIFVQKGVDALLVVDMLTLAARKTVDSIKLLAGDRDLLAGVKAAREFGIIVDLFTFREGTFAHALMGECDSSRMLDESGEFTTDKGKAKQNGRRTSRKKESAKQEQSPKPEPNSKPEQSQKPAQAQLPPQTQEQAAAPAQPTAQKSRRGRSRKTTKTPAVS